MTREERLKFCKKCDNRVFDMQTGLLCNLTGEKADFNGECESFVRDEAIVEYYDDELEVERSTILRTLSKDNVSELKNEQNFPKAIIAGIAAGIVGALLWGAITVKTGYQIGFMAIGVGALVGLCIRFVGKGMDQKFGLVGGGIALLSCLIGNLFSIVGFIATSENMEYLEVVELIGMSDLLSIMMESFEIVDILFYAIAAYEGYKFSFRTFTEKDLNEVSDRKFFRK